MPGCVIAVRAGSQGYLHGTSQWWGTDGRLRGPVQTIGVPLREHLALVDAQSILGAVGRCGLAVDHRANNDAALRPGRMHEHAEREAFLRVKHENSSHSGFRSEERRVGKES